MLRSITPLASITAAAVLLLACIAPARATDDPPAPTPAAPTSAEPTPPAAVAPAEIPDTPAGRALGKFLAAFAGDTFTLTEADFAPAFLKQVPLAQVEKLTADLRAKSGALKLKSIEPGATETRLVAIARTANGKGAFRIPVAVDEQGKIEGLRIAPAPAADVAPLKSWEDLDARLEAKAEFASVAAYEVITHPAMGGTGQGPPQELKSLHGLNDTENLAIGSSFKLFVLLALAEKIGRGDATWETELAIQDKLKSLPSGVMQNEKDGAKFSIKEFALKMISISDNTATDHLFAFVGRDHVETVFETHTDLKPMLAIESRRTLPFLTTREMFAIKLAEDRTLVDRYAQAIEPERRAMLAPPPADSTIENKPGEVHATQPSIAMAAFWSKPVAVDRVEWFVSTHNLCNVMMELDHRAGSQGGKLSALSSILGTNPGIPLNPKVWKRFFYKGGSEPGVLNLTWLLERDDGRTFTLSITLNDTKKVIPEEDAIALAARAIELLEREGHK